MRREAALRIEALDPPCTMIASRSPLTPALLAAALFVAAGPATAQASAPSDPVTRLAQQDDPDQGAVELKLLGRRLMERVEVHRTRLVRLDKLVDFYRGQGDLAKLREIEKLRQREVSAFQQTLSEYRRQLGNHDFERLASVMRFLMDRDRMQRAGVWNQDSGRRGGAAAPARPADVARAPARSTPTPSTDRTLDRQLQVERARASQRMQLAQRLQQARQEQLRLMAEQQRRYRPSAGPAARGGGPVRPPAAGAQGRPTQRPGATPQRPPQRRRP